MYGSTRGGARPEAERKGMLVVIVPGLEGEGGGVVGDAWRSRALWLCCFLGLIAFKYGNRSPLHNSRSLLLLPMKLEYNPAGSL
jgi:hypothetical protein